MASGSVSLRSPRWGAGGEGGAAYTALCEDRVKTREMFMHKSRLLSSFDQSAEQLHSALMPPGTCQLEGGAAANLGHALSRSQSPPLPMAHDHQPASPGHIPCLGPGSISVAQPAIPSPHDQAGQLGNICKAFPVQKASEQPQKVTADEEPWSPQTRMTLLTEALAAPGFLQVPA